MQQINETTNVKSDNQTGGSTVGKIGDSTHVQEIKISIWKERGIGALILLIVEVILAVIIKLLN